MGISPFGGLQCPETEKFSVRLTPPAAWFDVESRGTGSDPVAQLTLPLRRGYSV
jgi:hypothetical protein